MTDTAFIQPAEQPSELYISWHSQTSSGLVYFLLASLALHALLGFLAFRQITDKLQHASETDSVVMVQLTSSPASRVPPRLVSASVTSHQPPKYSPRSQQPAAVTYTTTSRQLPSAPKPAAASISYHPEGSQAPTSKQAATGYAEQADGLPTTQGIDTSLVTHKTATHQGAGGKSTVSEPAFGSASAPSFSRQALPIYPALARKRGREGTVLLRLHISQTGQLLQAEVLEDPGFGFADAALEAVHASSFSPGHRNGRPVSMKATLPIRFTLH